MKLIFAIVNGDDSQSVSKALTKKGFFATKLASTGGCTEDYLVDEVLDIIKAKSHKRKQYVPSAPSLGIGSYDSFPVEVSVGGATVFVTDVERFEKV